MHTNKQDKKKLVIAGTLDGDTQAMAQLTAQVSLATRTYILQASPYIRCCCTLYPKLHPISDAACCCSACGVVSLLFLCGIPTAGVHDMVWFGMEWQRKQFQDSRKRVPDAILDTNVINVN